MSEREQFNKKSVFSSLLDWRTTIGYVVLMMMVVIALTTSYRVQQNQAMRQCEAGNETRAVLDQVLLALAAPRDDDEPGEYEERLELYEQLEPLIELRDCHEEIGGQ